MALYQESTKLGEATTIERGKNLSVEAQIMQKRNQIKICGVFLLARLQGMMDSFILWVAIQDSFPQVTPSCQLPPFRPYFRRPMEEKKTNLGRCLNEKKVVKSGKSVIKKITTT